ncbi:hypothetical protein ABIB25_005700 [Nakamurella sp. UYEF19]|uniref:hypothetical protein n=1 Tax=Nakamurella sp. UYEF19 TaxID=1756392 RepID=UPI0033971E21
MDAAPDGLLIRWRRGRQHSWWAADRGQIDRSWAWRPGDWSDYAKTPVLEIRPGLKWSGAALGFGHVASLGEIRDVKKITGTDTLFQIEVPVELVLLAKAPAAARPALAKVLARVVTALAAGAAEGTRFAVHLCLGDMNNRAFGTMTDVSPLVLLANAVLESWPAARWRSCTRRSPRLTRQVAKLLGDLVARVERGPRSSKWDLAPMASPGAGSGPVRSGLIRQSSWL